MKHLDLFSGIGGFALAADRVWGDVEHTFCDNDLFCQEILKKHWPKAKIYGDIRTLTNTKTDRRDSEAQQKVDEKKSGRKEGRGFDDSSIYLLTGGFPCQPFSQAGRRKGTEDDRYLWPEMLRVIREFHPRWVIGENVGGIVTWSEGMVLEQVHVDLESEGYEVQSFIIPAVSKNAPHRRDRVWIIGNKSSEHSISGDGTRKSTGEREGEVFESAGKGSRDDVTDPRQQHESGSSERMETSKTKRTSRKFSSQRSDSDDTNSTSEGLERCNGTQGNGCSETGWKQNWLEVATRLCRVDDGIPKRMDRNPRLKALGNAIVPQVAEEIMKIIKELE